MLPLGQKLTQGRIAIDWRVVIHLAVPLMANSAIQVVLNLIDTGFVGQLSTAALAAMAATHWLIVMFIVLLGGISMAVQTVVAQAYGAKRFTYASHASWIALWATVFMVPLFTLIAYCGRSLLTPFGLTPEITALALEFWFPRLLGAPLAIALWALLGFFNGIARTRISLAINTVALLLNAVLAPLFIFYWHWGIAGAAWATNVATAIALIMASIIFVKGPDAIRFRARLTWRLSTQRLWTQLKLGLPMGIMVAADLFGFALFQLMQVKLSAVEGAATQIVMMLTSLAYLPGIGIAMAGTTLVGQAIGAGDQTWARLIGNKVTVLVMCYMGSIGLLLGLSGPWLIPLFVSDADPQAAAVIALARFILWIAAAYQLFDGLALGTNFCLRGAGDVMVPTLWVLVLAWGLFVPAVHSLSFHTGQGWVDWLPQFGFGAVGGWYAAVAYVFIISLVMAMRWHSRAWEH